MPGSGCSAFDGLNLNLKNLKKKMLLKVLKTVKNNLKSLQNHWKIMSFSLIFLTFVDLKLSSVCYTVVQ